MNYQTVTEFDLNEQRCWTDARWNMGLMRAKSHVAAVLNTLGEDANDERASRLVMCHLNRIMMFYAAMWDLETMDEALWYALHDVVFTECSPSCLVQNWCEYYEGRTWQQFPVALAKRAVLRELRQRQ